MSWAKAGKGDGGTVDPDAHAAGPSRPNRIQIIERGHEILDPQMLLMAAAHVEIETKSLTRAEPYLCTTHLEFVECLRGLDGLQVAVRVVQELVSTTKVRATWSARERL